MNKDITHLRMQWYATYSGSAELRLGGQRKGQLMGAVFVARDGMYRAVVPGSAGRRELGAFEKVSDAKAAVEREVLAHDERHPEIKRETGQRGLAL